MNSPRNRLCAGLLALLFLLLPGCTGNGAQTPTAMGRYVERELTLPADFNLVLDLHADSDGTLRLSGYSSVAGTHLQDLHEYHSADGGRTWTEDFPAWLPLFNGEDSPYGCEYLAWAPDGTRWFCIQLVEEDTYRQSFARLDGADLTLLDWPVPSASDGGGVERFQVAENGDLILDCWTEFLQVDPADGTVKNIYTASTNDGGSVTDGWALDGGALILSEHERIVWYDLGTGKEIRSITCQSVIPDIFDDSCYRTLDIGPDGALYFADPSGIYRATEGSDTLERLADGSLLSLSVPSVKQQGLVAADGQFFSLIWSSEVWGLLSFSYDPDIPSLPDTELTVYSLEDDPLISQAIGLFQKENPNVHVAYHVGLPLDASVTREDAIRALNTQLTAGKGPDVLILDGLPYASYIEKNILIDLSDLVEPLSDTGAVLSGILEAYRQADGTLPALPAQFQVPMLHGSDDAMSAIHDLPSLVAWLEDAKGSFRTPFFFDQAETYLRFFYPPMASSLTDDDGRIDAEKLSAFLVQMKRLTDLRTNPDDTGEDNGYKTEFNFSPLGWLAGYNGLDVGNLVRFQGLYAAWTASDKRSDGRTDLLFGCDAYLPVTSLAISAQSGQQALARSFIEAVLSDEVQRQAVGKGIPVSSAAFDRSAQSSGDRIDGSFSYYGTTLTDADGASVPVNLVVMYPPEDYRQAMAARFKGLDTPLLYDETVLSLLVDNTRDYWRGAKGLDETVNAIMQKLKLYEAE